MKVLYISHESVLNGAPKSLLEFIANIYTKGIQPIVVVPCGGKLKTELNKLKIRVRIVPFQQCIYTGKYGIEENIKYWKVNTVAVKKIIEIIHKEKVEIVHTNSMAVNVGAIAAYLTKVPHIWHFREYVEEDFHYKRINPILTYVLVRNSACCIAISKGVRRKYYKKYRVDSVKLYNGINSGLYYAPVRESVENTRQKKLLMAGTIAEGKGQWDAIKAIEMLVKKGLSIQLDIVGNGRIDFIDSLKEYVKMNGIEQNISFTGYTDELQKLRLNADAVLVCSRSEAFGRVTAEAMLAGKIVIGSASGGTMELIGTQEERGYLYTWNNVNELAEKIQYVIEHSDEVLKKEKMAQDFILKLTDLENYTDKIKEIYQKVLKESFL